jgi:glycogen(starch) synthase
MREGKRPQGKKAEQKLPAKTPKAAKPAAGNAKPKKKQPPGLPVMRDTGAAQAAEIVEVEKEPSVDERAPDLEGITIIELFRAPQSAAMEFPAAAPRQPVMVNTSEAQAAPPPPSSVEPVIEMPGAQSPIVQTPIAGPVESVVKATAPESPAAMETPIIETPVIEVVQEVVVIEQPVVEQPVDQQAVVEAAVEEPKQMDEPSEPIHVIPVAPPPVIDAQADAADSAAEPLLFECAWEVCWQLGGIYTVLKSKADMMLRKWGERYFLVGPYNPNTVAMEFEEQPAEGAVAVALDKMRQQGIKCYHGRWLIHGRPRTILIDYRGRFPSLGHDKYLLWKDHGIGTVDNDGEVNEVVAFGFSVSEFFRHLRVAAGSRPILAHFHEWMAGVAVPRIAHERINISTVFTTHATLLGRYLASDSDGFYDNLPYINADAEARKYMIYPRFQIERAAAHASTVFTTVSEVTGVEAEKLLGRKPDRILPNGLNIKRFTALHEFQNLHREHKEKIHEFVMGHFFPAYTFDLDNTLYIFTSGRYEYRNKGMDLFIEALYRLNQRLRWMPQRPTVVAFIVTKAATRHINVGVLQSQSMFEELKGVCRHLQDSIGDRLIHAAAHGRLPVLDDLVDEDERVRLKQGIYAWRNGRQPPIVTHDLADDGGDPILRHLRHRQLFNSVDDPVKVIFHAQFMTATSPLIGLDYEQFVRGCHMGVFPSYYEPWGYTPMESVALGVPAVTTDLSGFGAYVMSNLPNADEQGIKVMDRHKSFEDSANDLADHLVQFAMLTRRQRIELRNKVERLGEKFDWSVLISFYHDAHALALSRAGVAMPGRVEVRLV